MTAELGAPGAGLPSLETAFLRHVLLPIVCTSTSWPKAHDLFHNEGTRIIEIASGISEEHLHQPVLIRRVVGIEDSSRNWSIAMTMEHLITVGTAIAQRITALRDDGTTDNVDIAAFKPSGAIHGHAIRSFQSFVDDYPVTVGERFECTRRLPHPWFGPLSPHQWHCLAAAHQRIHRRQVTRIARLLGGADF